MRMSACSLEKFLDNETDLHPLTVEEVARSLSVLGHNADGLVVYVQANLSSLGLTSIGAISTYEHLQRLVLDNNTLVSLHPLRELKFLVYLSARNNRLDDRVFEHLAPSGNTLEHLELRNNCLTSLSGMQYLPFLLSFFAEENEITELSQDDLSKNDSLTQLHLQFNLIERIHVDTFACCKTLRTLNLSNNVISNTCFLSVVPTLEALNLEHNKIQNLDGFEKDSELLKLYLAHNMIEDWEELRKLTFVASLCELSLERNPILRSETQTPSLNASWQMEAESHVAQDVQFTANAESRFALNGTNFTNSFLSTMVPPSAKRFVRPVPADSVAMGPWDDDNRAEMPMLSISDLMRLRVIGVLSHLLSLDGVKVKPKELTRAVRLFGDDDSKIFPFGELSLTAGSPTSVVEFKNRR